MGRSTPLHPPRAAGLSPTCRTLLALVAVLPVWALSPSALANPQGAEVLERWLATHSGVASVRVDFTQTRRMRTLRVPNRQDGTLWMNHRSGQFRWELGSPAQTIVLREGGDLLIVRTPAKRYERRPAGAGGNGGGGIAMLASGFPRTPNEFHAKYRLLSVHRHDNVHRIATKPLGTAGRGVESFTFIVGADDYRLRGMELRLEDGSAVDTVFRRVVPNARIDPGVFRIDLAGYQ